MTNTHPIYGPPNHTPDEFVLTIRSLDRSAGWMADLRAYAPTTKGTIWRLTGVAAAEASEQVHLDMSSQIGCLVADMLRDLPATEARAAYVASGGLYQQLSFDGSPTGW